MFPKKKKIRLPSPQEALQMPSTPSVTNSTETTAAAAGNENQNGTKKSEIELAEELWSVEQQSALYKALVRWKPVGMPTC
jgi:hypothetical protein